MNKLRRFKFFLWYFGFVKVALIGYLKPRLIKISEDEIIVYLPLRRRSKNHLQSMYFGALCVGADLAGGLHGFYHADLAKQKISLMFKSFQAEFLSRPESDVYFVCNEGDTVRHMIEESLKSGKRINQPIHIKAYTQYPEQPNEVANFMLELSIRVIIDKY